MESGEDEQEGDEPHIDESQTIEMVSESSENAPPAVLTPTVSSTEEEETPKIVVGIH